MPHGSGRRQRRDPARSEAQSATRNRPDSTDPAYWPAPRWTHDLADHLHTENARAQAAVPPGTLCPPTHEPVADAWGELAHQRAAEALHRLDLAKAEETRERHFRDGLSALRAQHGVAPRMATPISARAAAWALHQNSRLLSAPAPMPGATLPLGPTSRAPLRSLSHRTSQA